MFKWLFRPKLNELLTEYLEVHNDLAANTIRLTRQSRALPKLSYAPMTPVIEAY